MKRCAACGTFFDGEECPDSHDTVEVWYPPPKPPATLCGVCGYYFTEPDCPRDHLEIHVDKKLITLGNAVTCDVTGIWTDVDTLPGLLVGVDGDSYRVIVALPGEHGGTAALTLPAEKIN